MNPSRPLLVLASVLAFESLARAQWTDVMSVDGSGVLGNSYSYLDGERNVMSADGNLVVFWSDAKNFVPGTVNYQVFVHDRTSGATEVASVDSSGAQANGWSQFGGISADGRFVVFTSGATNLVPNDTNGYIDVFVHDRVTGATELVSVDSGSIQGNGHSGIDYLGIPANAISADGRYVAFSSFASNLAAFDTNSAMDVFVRDRTNGSTTLVSTGSSGGAPYLNSYCQGISADGQKVVFYSYATTLVPGDTNGVADVFLHDCVTGVNTMVSVDSSGAPGNADSLAAAISPDGDAVVYASLASNLVFGDTNGMFDVFVHDYSGGTGIERVSVDSAGTQGDLDSNRPSISADHRFVAFSSNARNLVPGDHNVKSDVFVHDRTTGVTGRVSVNTTGSDPDDKSFNPTISQDGELVAFDSIATNLVAGDGNKVSDVFLRHRCDAAWTNYGSGVKGTLFTPSFTARTDPVLGTTITLDLDNSAGIDTAALLLVGYQRASIPTNRGGDLLVAATFWVPVSLPAGGTTFTDALPNDPGLCEFRFDLQAIETDAGASKGISFTPGLELVLGY